ncbi:MAG: hypothetical protein NDJ18_09170 [candidate division Zixibacteria bacterium]|nr:hypothetical protein [candidate division Zixibacteria bacterium]
MRRGYLLPALFILGLLSACAKEQTPRLVEDIGVAAYTDSMVELPRLRYANGDITINDRCPVRKVSLNPRLMPLFVNGKPLGFC